MRKLLCAIVFSLIFTPLPHPADARCSRMQSFPWTCTVGQCSQSVTVSYCTGVPFSWVCEETTNYCCDQSYPKATLTQTCPLAPTALIREAEKWDADTLEAVYVPSCDGGLVPLKTMVRAITQANVVNSETLEVPQPGNPAPNGSK